MQGTEHDKRRAHLKKIKCPICGTYLECEDRWVKPSDYDPEEEKRYQCVNCDIDIVIYY